MDFKSSELWGSSRFVVPLHNPISEFNARDGVDLNEYLAYSEQLGYGKTKTGTDDWLSLKQALPEIETAIAPETDQSFRIQRYNWPSDNKISESVVTVLNTPLGDHPDRPHVQYTAYRLASAINDSLILIVTPGFGYSGDLTTKQKSDLKNNSYDSVATSMLSLLGSLGIKSINCIGYSLGAEIASAIAANANDQIKVNNLVLVEAPRVSRSTKLERLSRFLLEYPNLKFAWNHPADSILRTVSNLKSSAPNRNLTAYLSSLFLDGTERTLFQALDRQAGLSLTLCSGQNSKISPLVANTRIASQLRLKFRDHKVRQIILPGETHAFAASVQRYAFIASLILK